MDENLWISRLPDFLLYSATLSDYKDGEDKDCVAFPDFTIDVVRKNPS